MSFSPLLSVQISGVRNIHIVYALFRRLLNECIFLSTTWRKIFSKWKHKIPILCLFFFLNSVLSFLSKLISCNTVFISRTPVIICHWFLSVLLFRKQVTDIKTDFCDLAFCLVRLPWKLEACIPAFVNRKDTLHAAFPISGMCLCDYFYF